MNFSNDFQNIARLIPAARQLSTTVAAKSAAAPKFEVADGFKTLKNLQAEYQVGDLTSQNDYSCILVRM